MKKTTAAEVLPTKPGTPFGGGLYSHRTFDGTQAIAIIAAGKEGDLANLTHAQALKKVKALRIGGHKDWQLPTRSDALGLFEQLRPKVKGTDDAFEIDLYWTSQQYEAGSSYAWCQSFYGGFQGYYLQTAPLRARAVRRLKI